MKAVSQGPVVPPDRGSQPSLPPLQLTLRMAAQALDDAAKSRQPVDIQMHLFMFVHWLLYHLKTFWIQIQEELSIL